jgi:nucleotide-binding universal stress UspA family protein
MVVVHAYASPPDVVPDADRRRIVEERRVNGRELLASVLARCREVAADISCEIELVEGPSADALLAVASDRNAAEIVVGSRGTGRSWTPIGSVSRQLLSVADRPVVVVPVAKRDAM